MKNNMVKNLLIVGTAVSSLLFGQSVYGQNGVAANAKTSPALSLLTGGASATPAKYAPTMDMATETDACFNMADLGTDNKLVCGDEDLQYDGMTGFYAWERKKSSASHPRQKLMTVAGQDPLISSLSVLPPSGSPSIYMASDGYTEGERAKGAMLQCVYNVDKDHPIVKLNYAAVLEKGHSTLASQEAFKDFAQPYIKIYAAVDGLKMLENFDISHYPSQASTVSGWTSVASDGAGHAAIWKDWSTVTVNLSDYVGHQVVFMIEIYDCAESAYNASTEQITLCDTHEAAHLYLSFECSNQIEQACAGANVELIAPAGCKAYKWSNNATTQSIKVSSTTAATYTCTLTSHYRGTYQMSSTVTPQTKNLGNVTICEGDVYKVETSPGIYSEYKEEGTYTYTKHTSDDVCDSLITFTLKIQQVNYTLPDAVIPQGGNVKVGDSTFTTEGLHTAIIHRAGACDSVVTIRVIMEDPVPTPDGCIDFTGLGDPNIIRCFDQDLAVKVVQAGVEYGWGDRVVKTKDNHPRERLMTKQRGDDLVPALQVLPQGGQYSVRIASEAYGEKDSLARATMAAFYLTVDKDNPVVVMSYAMLLGKSSHTVAKLTDIYADYAQPWNRIAIMDLDKQGGADYLTCPNFETRPYSNKSSVTGAKWKETTTGGKTYIWQDWDTIRLDLTPYIGHKLVFTFETFDCAIESGNITYKEIVLCKNHEVSRMYVNLNCEPRAITQECAGANIKLTAPEGFRYKWYVTKTPAKSLGTTQTISVSSTTAAEYTCELIGECETTKITSTVTPLTDRIEETIDEGSSIVIEGQTYTKAGTYTVIRHTSDTECDVVVTIKINVNPKPNPVHVYYERTIPQGVVFDFYGQDLTAEGDYEKTFKTATGNDSTVHLKLHILGETPKVDDEACFHMSTIGTTATAPTVAVESNLIKQTGTEQEFFTWDMKIPSTPKRETYMTKEGLDELCPDLSLLPPGESTSIRLASEEYKATDMAKGSAVIFRYTIDASHPYVNIKYAGVLETPGHSIAIMPGFKEYAQPYMTIYWTIDGVEMEKRTYFPSDANSVKAWKSFTDRHGNKAIWLDWQSVHLDLSKYVGKTLAIAMEVYDCAEENYDAVEKQITLCSHHHLAHGYCHVNCELKKEECSGVASVAQPVCADAENFNIHVTHTMGTASAYDLLFSNAAKAQGFADVNNVAASAAGDILVTVPHAKKENSINGMSYPMPNTYDATVVAHTSCGYDVQMPVKFSLLYPKDIIVQRWNDVLAITNSTYNGGYNFSNIRWHHAGETDESLLQYVFGDHDSYLYMGNNGGTLVMGTEYWAELTREGESTGICTCHLIPQTVQNAGTKFAGVQLVASRDGSRRLELVTEESGVYSLYDVCGRVIQSGYFGQEYGVMDIDLTTASGNIFILKFVTNNGQQDSKKVMVY